MKPIRVALAALLLLALPRPAVALFHFSVIDEVMTSYDGDPNAQFVEIRMLSGSQNRVDNTVLAKFDGSGNYEGDLLVIPADVTNSGNGVRWIMGTTAFEAASGIQVDFEFAPGLIQGSGMVCWGAPENLLPPMNPNSWEHDDPANYIDCLAYGTYSGPNPHGGDPTPLDADGHSLVRISETDDNLTDFACGDPATPTNNAGNSAELDATIPCPEPAAPLLLATGALALAISNRTRRGRRGAAPPPEDV
jgi:hypothetical protein